MFRPRLSAFFSSLTPPLSSTRLYMSSAANTAKSSKSTSSSSSKDARAKSSTSSNSSNAPPPIVALPSLSSHLFNLPQAKNMESLPLHPSHSAKRQAESEAKLKKALEWNNARQNAQLTTQPSQPPSRPPPLIYSEPSSPSSHSPPIMMRTRPKKSGG